VDRNNREVADLYQPLHPAILRMLRSVVEGARAAGIPVSLCGEMAADEKYLALLLGLGLRRLSVHPRSVPVLRRLAAEVDVAKIETIALECCELSSAQEVEERLRPRRSRGLARESA
jgi:phosphotransferase system enzyme I (PtsI)